MRSILRSTSLLLIVPAMFVAPLLAFALQGTYVPENNFTVSIVGRVNVPPLLGVQFPPVQWSSTVKNVPSESAEQATDAVVAQTKTMIENKIVDDGEGNLSVQPSGFTLVIDSITTARQTGPVDADGDPIPVPLPDP